MENNVDISDINKTISDKTSISKGSISALLSYKRKIYFARSLPLYTTSIILISLLYYLLDLENIFLDEYLLISNLLLINPRNA